MDTGMKFGKIKNPVLCRIFVFILIVLFASCSSVPKRPAEIFASRNMASNQLDLANRIANQGMYSDALIVLEDARRLAVTADDPSLLIKTSVARGNILFALGYHDEAFRHWDAALEEGKNADLAELASMARIYTARGRLILLINSGTIAGVEQIRNQVSGYIAAAKNDILVQAAGYVVLGMAEKELGRYAEAETALRRAVEIHDKERYLEEAAYDWYYIASIFSVSQKFDNALAALRTAIEFDRRAENGFGLASSWQAMGEVYLKMNRSADAATAFRRAAAIFSAIGLDESAQKAEEKARNSSG